MGAVGVVLGFWLLAYHERFEVLGMNLFAMGAVLLFASFVLYVRGKGLKSWGLFAGSLFYIIIATPFAGSFSSPTALGYVQFPGVVIALTVAAVSLICFFLCPRRPLIPKILTLALVALVFYFLVDILGYYYLHEMYGS